MLPYGIIVHEWVENSLSIPCLDKCITSGNSIFYFWCVIEVSLSNHVCFIDMLDPEENAPLLPFLQYYVRLLCWYFMVDLMNGWLPYYSVNHFINVDVCFLCNLQAWLPVDASVLLGNKIVFEKHSLRALYITVQLLQNMVNFLKNSRNGYPVTHLWGQAANHLLWFRSTVKPLI